MYQSNPVVSVNPSTKQLNRPDLKPSSGNDALYDRSHIKGPAASDKPTKESR